MPVRSLADVQELGINRIDTGALGAIFAELDPETHCHNSVMVLTRETVHPDADVHTRMFAPALGVGEDPATGSATGGLGAYLIEHGIVPATPPTTYLQAEQGLEIHRPSRLGIEIDGMPGNVEMVRVSGQAVLLIEGVLEW